MNLYLTEFLMKFRPLHDRVLVRRVEQEAKSTGGIIIPDTAQEKPPARGRHTGASTAAACHRRRLAQRPARCQPASETPAPSVANQI